ncbi:hypothetical protein L7F22_015136 [Adiantum nelumboides]|nr:hypothetical protein [Adiantum nelumboides]
MAVVMALCVAEKRQVQCDYAKFILESLIEANLKNSAKNKLYMSAGPILTRIAYQALGMIEDLPTASSQAALIQQAKYVPKAVKTTSSAASSRTTRSTKKDSSDEERTDTDKDQDSDESDHEDSPKKTEAPRPSAYEWSDEEDNSTPLDKKSKRPSTIEYLKKVEREKHAKEQRAAQLAREKIKEALSKKAEGPELEPSQGSPKRPRQEDKEELEHIQADPPPSSPIVSPTPPSSPITPFPPSSTPRTPPSPITLNPPRSPLALASPQQQQHFVEPSEVPPSEDKPSDQPMDRTEEEDKQDDTAKPRPAGIELQIPLMQLEEPSQEEAYEESESPIENLNKAEELKEDPIDLALEEKESENLDVALFRVQTVSLFNIREDYCLAAIAEVSQVAKDFVETEGESKEEFLALDFETSSQKFLEALNAFEFCLKRVAEEESALKDVNFEARLVEL